MIIERNKDEIIFKIPSDTNIDDLQDFMDLMEFKLISGKSKASTEDVDELAKLIKKGRWQKTKSKLDL